jgi:hypothetical protein
VTSKPLFTVTYGGWYQRTTLHLSEVYDLLALGHSDLNLDTQKLAQYRADFCFTSVTRETGDFEYIKCLTTSQIEFRYYEDGLYVLSLKSADVAVAQKILQSYYEQRLAPAIAYIFSLGAPTPKVLAAIKTTHPTVVSAVCSPSSRGDIRLGRIKGFDFGPVYGDVKSEALTVYKTPGYIVIFSDQHFKHPRELIEMQIFFREFKDQLHHYLNLHRQIWEEISDIKERGTVAGSEVETLRSRLDSYQKTINLIRSRISQMSTYVKTRASISKNLDLDTHLSAIFQYKFETLTNTHSYVQEIWKMTQEYVDTAIAVINEVKSQSTSNGINSLRLITTIGVLSGIFGYLSKDAFPRITFIGLWYFIVLMLGTWCINKLVSAFYQKSKYKLKFVGKLGIK